MKFVHPEFLNFLWLLFPVAGLLVYGMSRRKKILSAFASAPMLAAIIPGFSSTRRWFKISLMVLAIALVLVSLAGPQWGFHWEKIEQKGVDIMIALDCSKSMLAQDIKPNRLERAKREIIDLLGMMTSDRAGLVAFSGQAILQCPLTLDHKAFNIFLDVLEPGFLPADGTNIEAAIQTCYNGFEKNSDTEKAIILITDGEGTIGDTEQTLQTIVKEGIRIFCIGVGGLEGAPIPDDSGGFKKDREGNIVLSKVDETGLKKIAQITGGAYVRSVAGDMDLDLIYKDRIQATMTKKNLVSGRKKVWENRYQWFLFPALILLMAECILSPHRRVKHLLILMTAGSLFIQPSPAHAGSVFQSVQDGINAFENREYEQAKKSFIDAQLEEPDEKAIYYNIGTAAYMNQEYEQAEQNFLQASDTENMELRQKSLYNLANTRYRMGRLDDAITDYERLLTEFPEDIQAKENLEFVKKKQAEQQQEKDSKDNNQNQEDQNRENQNKENQDQDQQNPDKKNQGQQNQDQKNGDPQQSDPPDTEENSKNQAGQQPSDNNPTEQQGPKKEHQDQEKTDAQDLNQENKAQTDPSNPRPAQAKEIESQGEAGDQPLGKMLNRLQDKPGRAMMPVGNPVSNEKDW